jgi:hypothetical protein
MVLSGAVEDYVAIPTIRHIHTDYDYKRQLLDHGSTRPFQDQEALATARATAAALRRGRSVDTPGGQAKRPGRRATPARVLAAAAEMRLQPGETPDDVYRRYIAQALAHRVQGWDVPSMSDPQVAQRLGVHYNNKFIAVFTRM